MHEPERIAVAFARLLRGAGLDVPVGSTLLFAESLALLGLERTEPVYWAARTTLCKRPEDSETFDRCFGAFWQGEVPRSEAAAPAGGVVVASDAPEVGESPEAAPAPEPAAPTVSIRYSPTEVLKRRDFALYTTEEYVEARRLMADLRLTGARRRTRRLVRSRRSRGVPDVRRTVRDSLRAGGEPVVQRFREPAERPRRTVLLCDVSGSMEPYARILIRFLHTAVAGRNKVEAFAIGTRLTRLTRELSQRDPDAALAAAGRRVSDWSGGTRLGEGLRRFNDEWGVHGMARGAVVVILSDGWDRGDPEMLGEQMARLRRVAHKVVWVNPLKASAGYEPLARGMAAALPYVDEFVEGHSLASLEQLATAIGGAR